MKLFQSSLGKHFRTSLGKPFQASPGKPFQASLGKPFQDSLGKRCRTSLGKHFRTFLGKPFQAFLRKPFQASLGKPFQASLGKSFQASLRKPFQASLGKLFLFSLGKPCHNFLEKPLQASLEFCSYFCIFFEYLNRNSSSFRFHCYLSLNTSKSSPKHESSKSNRMFWKQIHITFQELWQEYNKYKTNKMVLVKFLQKIIEEIRSKKKKKFLDFLGNSSKFCFFNKILFVINNTTELGLATLADFHAHDI